MSTTNASITKKYCANSGKWCEFANLQGFCTLTACCKRVIYNDHTWYMNDNVIKRWNRHKESEVMTTEEAIQWFEKNPFMHKDHEPFKMAVEALKQQLKAEQYKSQIYDFFRNPTAEERKAVADYIDSISISTGINVFDLMDESQTENPCNGCEYSKPYIEYKCTHPSCKFEDEPQMGCPESCPSRDICTKSDTDCIWRKGRI